MAFHYLTNVPPEKAREDYLRLLERNGFAPREETVPTEEAGGRVTARAVYAQICAPHYPASAMDGVALNAKLTFGATETTPVCLRPGQFTMVDTGDPIPEGCDGVVMIEDVMRSDDGSIRLHAPATPWQHIRQIGEDVCAGEMLLPSYTQITPAAVGAMLAGGVLAVTVLCRPVVGLIPTGDEIIPPTASPETGQIIEFNSAIFSAMLTQWNAVPRRYPIVPDDEGRIKAMLSKALDECDMVLLNAGSSAGREDYAAQVIEALGGVCCHGIAMRPGKPAILGYRGGKPVLGVPGYPVSGIVVLEQFLKPIIDGWYRAAAQPPLIREATLCRGVVSGLKYREFVRVRMGKVGAGLIATPLNRGAGVVTSFMKADGILEIPQALEGYEAGSRVKVRLLRPESELENTLVVTGSHDPLLDEAAELLHRADPSLFMSSSHVGSMGGIMAVRRGECHAAGVHLLNEADGCYNTAYIRRYFPSGGVRLVECVGRTQGLMVAAGNPKGIKGVHDLARDGLRYVNRQKGSGTRLLIDYLCRKERVDPAQIEGYLREEFTHTAVAAQIASGTADAGMGIYSAAKLYGLDFIPVCMEQYDLLIPDEAWGLDQTRRFLEVLAGEAFRLRLESMGGYKLEHPGRVRERF